MNITLNGITGTVDKQYQNQNSTPAHDGDVLGLTVSYPPDWKLQVDTAGDGVDLFDPTNTYIGGAYNVGGVLAIAVVKNVTRKDDYPNGDSVIVIINDGTSIGIRG